VLCTFQPRIRDAEAVLVVNPLMEAMVGPYTDKVRTVTAGMDPARFPWPWPDDPARKAGETGRPIRLIFAGLVQEQIKGFDVLHEACRLLWARRQDFELVATSDPPCRLDEFTRLIGWQSQAALPREIRAADILVMSTVAQEALGRTAVEAMAAGRPVVASRIGGLSFTVVDGATGLLCEPGNSADLAAKLEVLFNDPDLRERMGLAGRKRFEQEYAWDVIVERHYRPLLRPRDRGGRGGAADLRSAESAGVETRAEQKMSFPLVPQPGPSRNGFTPVFPQPADHARLVDDVARTFDLGRSDVERKLQTYRSFHQSKDYERTLGEFKTLCFEEAFVLYVAMSVRRPRAVVEIGTQQAKSTRRILDIKNVLGLETRVVCCDLANEVQFFAPHEGELLLGDLTGRFHEMLRDVDPELIFLDCHAYGLLVEIVGSVLRYTAPRTLAIHDCGRGLCNPRMQIARDDPNVTSSTGVWERHVLADAAGLAGPFDPRLDDWRGATRRLRIFDTTHGLALLIPRADRSAVPAVAERASSPAPPIEP
jgi:hypothetical protein